MKRRGLRMRAVMAVILMVLFYVFALAAAAALAWAGVELGGTVVAHFRGRAIVFGLLLALALLLAALVVAWSLVPRFDRFEPPGPELDRRKHPQLFREIYRVAARANEAPPAHVYLVADVNAFVTERGGLGGLGARRVMGVGLGLLNALTVSQFRAVLAHEFGHFAGGDTKLGRWLYKARAAMVRTLQNLASTAESASQVHDVALLAVVFHLVQAPFLWFARFYLRFTLALSRAQELAADALAVQLEGAEALTSGLRRVRAAAPAFAAYINGEVSPFLGQGVLPPLSAGFRTFLSTDEVTETSHRLVEAALEEEPDALDSHPPLRERLAHASTVPGPTPSPDERLAVELLGEVTELELALARAWSDDAPLKTVSWEASGAALVAGLREEAKSPTVKTVLEGLTCETMPHDASALRALVKRAHPAEAAQLEKKDVLQFVGACLTRAVNGALLEAGFEVRNAPGAPLRFVRGEESVEPAPVVRRYLEGQLPMEAWQAQWRALGVADHPLA